MTSGRSSLIGSLVSLPEHARRKALARLTPAECQALLYDWPSWARPAQLAPKGDWTTWLILAGRGFGKTRSGAEWVREEVDSKRAGRIALVAEDAGDARDVMVEGESGILAISPPWNRPIYRPSVKRLVWPNGAIATIFSADDPDALRGPQFDLAWCDEIAKWRYARDAWDNLQFGLRLGQRPRQVVTTTPRPIPLLKEIIAEPETVITKGSTNENRANLASAFLTKVVRKYEGTRLGRQELEAELLDDVPGALWTLPMLEACRVNAAPDLVRIVVGVDPSGTKGDEESRSDNVGIVVAGIDVHGTGHVLADCTCNLSPDGWGKQAVMAFHEFGADRIVAETNYGGAMVEHVIRAADRSVPVSLVTASRGKIVRAEPIASLYEQRRIKHVGTFSQLEDEMRNFTTGGYIGGASPDRADALVWALSALMLAEEKSVGMILRSKHRA